MSDWLTTFKRVGGWLLLLVLLAGVAWAAIIIVQDIRTSYLGWGRVVASLNSQVGPIVAWSASALPTLVQIIAWAGLAAGSPILKHNTFLWLAIAAFVCDTIADAIALGFGAHVSTGEWGKVAAVVFTTLGMYGLLSEFMLLFCLTSAITQASKLQKPNLGFRGSHRTEDLLSGVMLGGMGWDEPPPYSSKFEEPLVQRRHKAA